jgi:hypothetical protein
MPLHPRQISIEDCFNPTVKASMMRIHNVSAVEHNGVSSPTTGFEMAVRKSLVCDFVIETNENVEEKINPLSLLENTNKDAILHIASYLDSIELVRLSLTCKRLGGSDSHNDNKSLMEKAAHQIFNEAQVVEKNALPKTEGESWISLYNELLLLRSPLVFDQLYGREMRYPVNQSIDYTFQVNNSFTGMCNHTMRAGKHYAKYTKLVGEGLYIGVMRPLNSLDERSYEWLNPFSDNNWMLHQVGNGQWSGSDIDACAYDNTDGECTWINWHEESMLVTEWEGMETSGNGDVIGLLLDLDEGNLSVYKNERRLGVMKDGLSGEYCWMVYLQTKNCSIKIERAQVPAS